MKYYLNGVDFAQYGVYVSDSRGFLDALELKEPVALDWPDYHGQQVDLSAPRYRSRELILECFSTAISKSDSVQKLTEFFNELSKPGLHRLMVDTGEVKPLVYDVYRQGAVSVKKVWRGGVNIGQFTLTLIEPDPIKKVYKHIAATGAMQVSFTLTSEKLVTIKWGDGTSTTGRGVDVLLSHDYANAGTYYPVISGVIDEISAITTNATLVWNSL